MQHIHTCTTFQIIVISLTKIIMDTSLYIYNILISLQSIIRHSIFFKSTNAKTKRIDDRKNEFSLNFDCNNSLMPLNSHGQ